MAEDKSPKELREMTLNELMLDIAREVRNYLEEGMAGIAANFIATSCEVEKLTPLFDKQMITAWIERGHVHLIPSGKEDAPGQQEWVIDAGLIFASYWASLPETGRTMEAVKSFMVLVDAEIGAQLNDMIAGHPIAWLCDLNSK